MEGDNQDLVQPAANQPAEPLTPLTAFEDAPRLGRRKFIPKPTTITRSDPGKLRLDELKAVIVHLANKNFDSTMYIIRSWSKSGQ